MNKLFPTVFRIRAATTANVFLFFLQRLWFVGKLIPDRIYAAGRTKTVLTTVALLFSFLWDVLRRCGYLTFVILLLPCFLQTDEFLPTGPYMAEFTHVLFWTSCFIPFFSMCFALECTRERFTVIKYMRANPRRYLTATLPISLGFHYLSFLPGLLLSVWIAGGSAADAVRLWVILLAFRLTGEAFQLAWYKHRKKAFFRNQTVSYIVVFSGIIYAYVAVINSWPLYESRLLLSRPGMIAVMIMALLSILYIFVLYGNWDQAVLQNLKPEYIRTKRKAVMAVSDVEMRDTDLDTKAEHRSGFERKTGYEYFNALFFLRHRRQLQKPINTRLMITGAVLAIAIVLLPFSQIRQLYTHLTDYLPIFVFVMYLISTGDRACRAMFYNCDISLLRYNFYRKPNVILQNFYIRLRYLARDNLMVAAAICAAVIILTALAGTTPLSFEMLFFGISILLLSVFFSVHHLFMYYVFQPYTADLAIRNPMYRIINMIIYIICYNIFYLKTAGSIFAMAVSAATAAYIIIALLAVRRYSPKNFRVK